MIDEILHGATPDRVGAVLKKKLVAEKERKDEEKRKKEECIATNWFMNVCFDYVQKDETVRACVGVIIVLNVISVLLESEQSISSLGAAQTFFNGKRVIASTLKAGLDCKLLFLLLNPLQT